MQDLDAILSHIDPDQSYDEWLKVGMALKQEGEPLSVWDEWSRRGSKYHEGECEKKWNGFNGEGVTGGTLVHIAQQYGYKPAAAADDPMAGNYDLHNLLLDEYHIDSAFVSTEKLPPATSQYSPKGDMIEYLDALFDPEDYVGYCVKFRLDKKDGKWKPNGTQFSRKAGDILKILRAAPGKEVPEAAWGTLNEEAGAYIRFNPLDGKGENNANVTRWKYCLLESDDIPQEKQWSLIKAMNLPCEFVVDSGGHSIHAIVRIDAVNAAQYRQRVTDVYDFAEKSGFKPDQQDKNESRFSRLPGAKRGGCYQRILARRIGAESYEKWLEWRQEQADDLPPDTTLADVWNDLPPLKEELIPGVLRVGHKMLLAGPSKAGKSFLLINLAISLAEGVDWIGMQCRQGRVCYVNLELDEASCFRRFKDIYTRRGLDPKHLDAIDIWNLRGHAVPMDKLAPVLIHRFKDQHYEAVIIDPIYKIITGDENDATEMSRFCSYFDKVATEMRTAVIYCHHHSKGARGKYANAADRSSGSGVFARDPDAILDLSEIKTDGYEANYRADHPAAAEVLTGWELNGTLREFAPMKPTRLWFDYPLHVPDMNNYLGTAGYADMDANETGVGQGQKKKTDRFEDVRNLLEIHKGEDAVSLEEVGISKDNAKKIFSTKSDYETGQLDGVDVVMRRGIDKCRFRGREYHRVRKGNRTEWN